MTDRNQTPVEKVAHGVEAIRADRAAELETERFDRAAGLESDRVDFAEAVEADREERAAGVEFTRSELAAILEADRKRHNLQLEQRLRERTKVINRRFGFILVLVVAVFGLLAYRSEVNDSATRANGRAIVLGLHNACLSRVETAIQYNEGREALVQMAANAPRVPPRTPEEIAILVKQLRDGLLLPIEDCGPTP